MARSTRRWSSPARRLTRFRWTAVSPWLTWLSRPAAKPGIFHVDDKTLALRKDRGRNGHIRFMSRTPTPRTPRSSSTTSSTWSRRCRCRIRRPTRTGQRGGKCQNRPGGHRQLHQRPYRRPAPGRRILKGKKVSPDVRCIIIPGTQQVYLDALNEGLHRDSSSTPARLSARRPAGHAWAATWASWPTARAASPPPTATLSAAWAAQIRSLPGQPGRRRRQRYRGQDRQP